LGDANRFAHAKSRLGDRPQQIKSTRSTSATKKLKYQNSVTNFTSKTLEIVSKLQYRFDKFETKWQCTRGRAIHGIIRFPTPDAFRAKVANFPKIKADSRKSNQRWQNQFPGPRQLQNC